MRAGLLVVVMLAGGPIGLSGCNKEAPPGDATKPEKSPPPAMSLRWGADHRTPRTRPTFPPSQKPLSQEQRDAASKAGVEPVMEIDLGGGAMMAMVLIPIGSFKMGSPASEKHRCNDEVQHEVTISKPFYVGITEVTQAQWEYSCRAGTKTAYPWGDKPPSAPEGARIRPRRNPRRTRCAQSLVRQAEALFSSRFSFLRKDSVGCTAA